MYDATSFLDLLGTHAADFRSDYLGKQLLLSRGGERAAQVPLDDYERSVNDVINHGGLRASSVRVVRDGLDYEGELGKRAAGDQSGAEPYVEPRYLARAFAEGYTIVVRNLDRYLPVVSALASQVAREFGCRIRVNAYVTPADSRGLRLHYDAHDVFVLQVSGSKEWSLCEPAIKWPVESFAWHRITDSKRASYTASAAEIARLQLRAGDVLYVPRGFLHAAQTSDEASIHLTIVMHTVTRADIAAALLRHREGSEWFRESVDVTALLNDEATARAVVEAISAKLQEIPADADIRRFVWQARGTTAENAATWPSAVLRQAAAIRDPASFGSYETPEGLLWFLERSGDQLILHTNITRIRLSPNAYDLVAAIMEAPAPVSQAKLSENFPPQQVAALIETLLQVGILQPSRADGDE